MIHQRNGGLMTLILYLLTADRNAQLRPNRINVQITCCHLVDAIGNREIGVCSSQLTFIEKSMPPPPTNLDLRISAYRHSSGR